MTVSFQYANNHAIPKADFVAAWIELVSRYGPAGADPYVVGIPRLNSINNIATYIGGKEFSVEYLCRMLVPNGYRNVMQATTPFMVANAHLLTACQVTNPLTGNLVNGARLIDPRVPAHIKALFDADIDDAATEEIIEQNEPLPADQPALTQRTALVAQLVDEIHKSQMINCYRKAEISTVTGWTKRLNSYFWPSPQFGYRSTNIAVASMSDRAAALAKKSDWTAEDGVAAVMLANDIFRWGGVPQETESVTPENIQAVMRAAVNAKIGDRRPLMNSGWTKVAAFASNHLEGLPGQHPQVIWDSRVATSITKRLDALLVDVPEAQVPSCFSRIGRVDIGRGGNRPAKLKLKWVNGYGSWSAQLAGSQLVAEMRDVLNGDPEKYGKMPLPENGANGPWTMRGVEMVLFMDGY